MKSVNSDEMYGIIVNKGLVFVITCLYTRVLYFRFLDWERPELISF